MGKDAIYELPSRFAKLFFTLRVPEQVFAAFADGNVGMHSAAVDTDDWLRQKRSGQSHIARDLPADQLVELNVVGRGHHFRVVVVDFELRRRNFGVVLLVLEPHRPLHFRSRVDEAAQRIARQRMIISARVHVFEFARLMICALGIRPIEQEAFDFIGRVQCVALLLVQSLGESLEARRPCR